MAWLEDVSAGKLPARTIGKSPGRLCTTRRRKFERRAALGAQAPPGGRYSRRKLPSFFILSYLGSNRKKARPADVLRMAR